MISVHPYHPKHLEQVKPRDCHSGEVISPITTDALTYIYQDRPIAIIGGYFPLSGVLQLWAILSEDVKNCPVSFHKATKLLIEFYAEKYNIRRAQMQVRSDYSMGKKWAASLGFVYEGDMKRFGADDADYSLFARTVWQ